ncbi:hypothetical protein PFBG_02413 [Plasmodium falciparum 7G8]|uniref:Uncharacterized protein n=1 Tax=Plasmodium falciparum (isolate 7G8) TaxID=57266 RepID=W7FFI7_PLAF8|nr:hypothetical protein PFBG_02413 [Plasmodium falciparum 7G8]
MKNPKENTIVCRRLHRVNMIYATVSNNYNYICIITFCDNIYNVELFSTHNSMHKLFRKCINDELNKVYISNNNSYICVTTKTGSMYILNIKGKIIHKKESLHALYICKKNNKTLHGKITQNGIKRKRNQQGEYHNEDQHEYPHVSKIRKEEYNSDLLNKIKEHKNDNTPIVNSPDEVINLERYQELIDERQEKKNKNKNNYNNDNNIRTYQNHSKNKEHEYTIHNLYPIKNEKNKKKSNLQWNETKIMNSNSLFCSELSSVKNYLYDNSIMSISRAENDMCTNNTSTNNICTNDLCTNNLCTNNLCTNNIDNDINLSTDEHKDRGTYAYHKKCDTYNNRYNGEDNEMSYAKCIHSCDNNNLKEKDIQKKEYEKQGLEIFDIYWITIEKDNKYEFIEKSDYIQNYNFHNSIHIIYSLDIGFYILCSINLKIIIYKYNILENFYKNINVYNKIRNNISKYFEQELLYKRSKETNEKYLKFLKIYTRKSFCIDKNYNMNISYNRYMKRTQKSKKKKSINLSSYKNNNMLNVKNHIVQQIFNDSFFDIKQSYISHDQNYILINYYLNIKKKYDNNNDEDNNNDDDNNNNDDHNNNYDNNSNNNLHYKSYVDIQKICKNRDRKKYHHAYMIPSHKYKSCLVGIQKIQRINNKECKYIEMLVIYILSSYEILRTILHIYERMSNLYSSFDGYQKLYDIYKNILLLPDAIKKYYYKDRCIIHFSKYIKNRKENFDENLYNLFFKENEKKDFDKYYKIINNMINQNTVCCACAKYNYFNQQKYKQTQQSINYHQDIQKKNIILNSNNQEKHLININRNVVYQSNECARIKTPSKPKKISDISSSRQVNKNAGNTNGKMSHKDGNNFMEMENEMNIYSKISKSSTNCVEEENHFCNSNYHDGDFHKGDHHNDDFHKGDHHNGPFHKHRYYNFNNYPYNDGDTHYSSENGSSIDMGDEDNILIAEWKIERKFLKSRKFYIKNGDNICKNCKEILKKDVLEHFEKFELNYDIPRKNIKLNEEEIYNSLIKDIYIMYKEKKCPLNILLLLQEISDKDLEMYMNKFQPIVCFFEKRFLQDINEHLNNLYKIINICKQLFDNINLILKTNISNEQINKLYDNILFCLNTFKSFYELQKHLNIFLLLIELLLFISKNIFFENFPHYKETFSNYKNIEILKNYNFDNNQKINFNFFDNHLHSNHFKTHNLYIKLNKIKYNLIFILKSFSQNNNLHHLYNFAILNVPENTFNYFTLPKIYNKKMYTLHKTISYFNDSMYKDYIHLHPFYISTCDKYAFLNITKYYQCKKSFKLLQKKSLKINLYPLDVLNIVALSKNVFYIFTRSDQNLNITSLKVKYPSFKKNMLKSKKEDITSSNICVLKCTNLESYFPNTNNINLKIQTLCNSIIASFEPDMCFILQA